MKTIEHIIAINQETLRVHVCPAYPWTQKYNQSDIVKNTNDLFWARLSLIQGRPQGERGQIPQKQEKSVVEKMVLDRFQRCQKRQSPGRSDRKWLINFTLRFWHLNFKLFQKISNLNWFLEQTLKNLPLCFLKSF